ncbi:HPr family phosphocarrier protein [Desmospora activa]|uniref:PTS HPr component family protein n=1 Tax=Desmospora activa DSM 45169 TaxID=1121389 RepID=A0A2T4Z767_9BACL|nr:HPr family phosphocarrier protein [Desmospora activa]PTM57726.1 PTS HPr component family protein [Desmospora activa DSM 45169]
MRVERTLYVERIWSIQEMAVFVSMARELDNPITLEYRSGTANGKGLLGIVSLMMKVTTGETIRLVVSGSGASDAMAALLKQLPLGIVADPKNQNCVSHTL